MAVSNCEYEYELRVMKWLRDAAEFNGRDFVQCPLKSLTLILELAETGLEYRYAEDDRK